MAGSPKPRSSTTTVSSGAVAMVIVGGVIAVVTALLALLMPYYVGGTPRHPLYFVSAGWMAIGQTPSGASGADVAVFVIVDAVFLLVFFLLVAEVVLIVAFVIPRRAGRRSTGWARWIAWLLILASAASGLLLLAGTARAADHVTPGPAWIFLLLTALVTAILVFPPSLRRVWTTKP
jgi:hypothetical protein